MGKTIKAKSDLGVNSIMDTVMVPDGFARVCDGLDIRSGVARPWQAPSVYRDLDDFATSNIWEYRGKWYESDKHRTYHGEYIYGREAVYFTEEGEDHSAPQKIIAGTQVDLGIARPYGAPIVTAYDSVSPTSFSILVTGAGGVPEGVASYRISAIKSGSILPPSDPIKVQTLEASTILLAWRAVPGADGYAIFGRTPDAEKLIIELGNTTEWTDDGTIAEKSDTAASHEVSQSYQYVYTYYRDVNGSKDESGPSELSAVTDASKITTVTRVPLTDGSFPSTSPKFLVSTYPLTVYNSAYSVEISDLDIDTLPDATIVTTSTAHGMTGGDAVHIPGVFGELSDVEYVVSVPYELSTPTAHIAGYAVGGTLSGSHTYKVVAVRGGTSAAVANPAQTLGNNIVATVPGGSGSVIVAFDYNSSGTSAFIVYRDGNPVQVVPVTVRTWTDTGAATIPGISLPVTNETSTRCFTVNREISLSFFPFAPRLVKSLCDIVLTGATALAPVAGDVIVLSGLTTLSLLNGLCYVTAYNNTTKRITIKKYAAFLDGQADSTTGAYLQWNPSNGYLKGWRIYRVGDTDEFLRVADLPMDVASFVDLVATEDLGVAIPTAYTSNGLQVVYDKAPSGLKRMVTHYGMRFGIVDDLVRWTPTNVPDAWPDVYYAAFPSRPVALASFRQIMCVLCEDGLYALVGNTPSTISPAGPFGNLGCIAPFSVQSSNYGLLWLSKVGVAFSPDGMSSRCITSDRVQGKYFYAPSTPATDGSLIGFGWYLPASQTVQYAESMREESINANKFPVTQVSNDLPAGYESVDIKSAFWDNRYFLYYVGPTRHARSGMVSLDMAFQSMPITTLPIKPTSVHVSLGGDCYMLLSPMPITTVTITSPL